MVSSGAISPARAPASIDMLQIVIRAFHRQRADRRAAVLDDVAGAAADADPADDREDDVLRGDAGGKLAVDRDRASSSACAASSVCVASTCSTSLVPMPKASAPNAPCVQVWQSPQTIVMPGLGQPQLGADDVDDALAGIAQAVAAGCRTPRSCCASASICLRRDRIGDRRPRARWSGRVIHGRDGEVGAADRAARQPQPVERLRADVTSWTRCRSM